MSWKLMVTQQQRAKSQITLSLWVRKNGSATMSVSMTSALGGMLGFEKAEFAEVLIGDDDHAGLMILRPAAQGIKVIRLKHIMAVRFPPLAGVVLKANGTRCDYEKEDGGGLVLTLPEWARPAPPNAAGIAAVETIELKPASLEMQGNSLVIGAKSVVLTKSQAQIVSLLVKNFGKPVRRQAIMDELYSLDPNGGANEKIIDMQLMNIRKKLAEAKLDVIIKTHRQFGFEICRAIAA